MISLIIKKDWQIKPSNFLQKQEYNFYLSFMKDFCQYDAESSKWFVQPNEVGKILSYCKQRGFHIKTEAELTSNFIETEQKRIELEEKSVRISMKDGKISFYMKHPNMLFSEIFNPKSSYLSGLFEYVRKGNSYQTSLFPLAIEAMKVLLDNGFNVLKGSTFENAYQVYRIQEKSFEEQDPEVTKHLRGKLFNHQNKALKFIEKTDGKCLLGMCMGCVDGNAIVTVNRNGNSFKISLKELHEKMNGKESGRWGKGCHWDLSIPTSIRCFFEGKLRSMPIGETFERGIKPTVILKMENGKSVRCTPDHPVLTTDGWIHAKDCLGKIVLTNGTPVCSECGSTKGVSTYEYAKYKGICRSCIQKKRATNEGTISGDGYRYIKVSKHPNQSNARGSLGIGQHRLVVEANINNVSYDDWIRICRECRDMSGYNFLTKDIHVHHKNGNKLDNRIENLEILDAKIHLSLHGDIANLPIFIPKNSICISVEKSDDIEVYDVHVPIAETFVADGVIVHNSGKSLTVLAHAAKYNLRVAVVCPKTMRRTWIQEADKFFGWYGVELEKHSEIDIINSRIVSCNYESVKKYTSILEKFDLLVIDESHYIKNKKAKRTEQVTELSQKFSKKILLSGTAVKNRRDELFPQLRIIDPIEYSDKNTGEFSKNSCMDEGAFWESILDVYLSMTKSEVLSFLPSKTIMRFDRDVEDPVGLPNCIEEMTLYKHMCAQSKVELTIEKIRDIIDNSDDSLLVGSEFRDICQAIFEAFPDDSIYHDGQMPNELREQAKIDYQTGTKRIFVSTRPSLAVGATLHKANHVIFNDLPWNAADIQQFEDRTHRIGQHKPVFVHWVVAKNSEFDANLVELISQKYELQKAICEGKTLTKEEREFLAKPINIFKLIKRKYDDNELF